ncbi:undecaprenyl-diphosphate phosphatase [Rhodovulum adriaticum]|uniref:Undecaprenyl-diphosphatase n=1 Tax=Rhodovulum adriaticum TaxID=35804 RepID=A0A4R2P1M7_RHOAD|nr:undecaprenyl-diphosphate phosphatase [Rhodovulum adriaticum]MBK1635294.1 undecaprenyl-diphosphatase [Rhodovulum adriaticum]TCP27771.1 undecaprenyl-diphosphatase [Rhodovulum adriaticum]
MPLYHLLLLAVIQGVTEFLPISSSGHLILLPGLTGMADQGLVIDVAVHVGTLGAVVLYFRKDVALALGGLGRLARGQIDTTGAFLALCLIVATIPVMILGLVIKLTGLDEALRSIAVIGWTMLLFGLLLWVVDMRAPRVRKAPQWTLKHAIIMGLWQAVALIPGTSRSGITITGARALGYDRVGAARLSMLMSIPTILIAGLVVGGEVVLDADMAMLRDGAIAAAFAFASALAALAVMMRLARSISFTPYVLYRVILGLVLLYVAYV